MEKTSLFDLVDARELIEILKSIDKSLERIASAISTTENKNSHGD